MNLLILKGFNNYFNRKIKKYSDLADYIANSSEHYLFGDVNFNPNDGVATSQVIGSENQQQTGGPEPVPLNWEVDGSPDYLIAYTSETIDEQVVNTIHSRWFVLESVRTRAGQYQLALKRDIIADKLEEILTNPCFVEKGYVQDTDPLIFNEEGVSLNQIKVGENVLTDETQVPWLVLYIAKNYKTNNGTEEAVPIEGKQTLDISQAIDYDELPWSNIENGISSNTTTIIRRIAGAGEINISPIIGYYLDATAVGRYITNSQRINIRHTYLSSSNTWKVDYNTTNIVDNYTRMDVPFPTPPLFVQHIAALTRKQLNLTPASTTVRWGSNNDGNIVCTVYRKINPFTSGSEAISKAKAVGQWFIDHGGLNNETTSIRNAVINYLNTKKAALQANVSHISPQANMEAYVGGNQSFLPAATLLSYNNKIVKSGVNYYRIKIKRQNNYVRPIDYFSLNADNQIIADISHQNNLINNYMLQDSMTIQNWTYNKNTSNNLTETFFEHAWFDVQYERVSGDLLRFTLPKPSDRTQLNDAAYDMLVMPYGAIPFKIPNDGNTETLSFTSSKEASIGMMRSIAAQIGDACYDLQLLPYCPYREVAEQYGEDGFIDFGLTTPFPTSSWSGVYKINNSGDTPNKANARTIALWCPYSSGTLDILHTIEKPENETYKEFNTFKRFRLVSPNYASVFEFSPLKNNGVTTFNVDFNYRPYNPYIHIAPYFKSIEEGGLYGVDTNDQRGLVLQGDFSVGYYSDAWANYQIQNANYANIFNRQLQNIDFNQRQEREKFHVDRTTEGITEVLGLGGGLSGAKSFSGLGPWGMLGGAIGGTVGGITAHGVGTYYDKKWMQESQQEERSYAVDMYNLNLCNVKALPYGLAKSDALTENFKFFPFIEEYDCTDKEKEVFRNKIKYDGMTVNAIGTLADYLPQNNEYDFQLLRGRMIMLDNITDDFQIANDIYTEVKKGFYYVPPVEVPVPDAESGD